MSEEAGRKDDQEKSPWNLLPWRATEEVVRVLRFGAEKYGENNWIRVENGRSRYFAAAIRHMVAWQRGEKRDPETGLPHLAHALCSVMFLLEKELEEEE